MYLSALQKQTSHSLKKVFCEQRSKMTHKISASFHASNDFVKPDVHSVQMLRFGNKLIKNTSVTPVWTMFGISRQNLKSVLDMKTGDTFYIFISMSTYLYIR